MIFGKFFEKQRKLRANLNKHTMNTQGYSFKVQPLPPEDGGGWLATVPELAGCMTDGDTIEEALINLEDAIQCWCEVQVEVGREVPKPVFYGEDK